MAFVEDKQAKRTLETGIGRRVLGVECPIRNKTGDVCKECERVKKLWRQNTAATEQEARDKQAKDSYFLNIQMRDGTLTPLKIGKKVAKSLKTKLERYKEKTGKVFGFANLEEGEWLAINKSGENKNFEYDLEILGEKADPVTEATVKGMHPLDNLTVDFNNGELNLEDIAAIASGESFEFRMLPIPTGEGKATEMILRYYHWYCNEADILGGGEVDDVVGTGTDAPKEFQEYMDVGVTEDSEVMPDEEKHQYTMDDKPECTEKAKAGKKKKK
jgi:hypothetical protein